MKRETKAEKEKRIKEILRRLEEYYKDAKPALHYDNPFELLIAVMLSAQCTDKRVNVVTDELFKQYNSPKAIAELGGEQLEPLIRSCGLSKTKSKNIALTCQMLLDEYDGLVPKQIDVLQTLPGVGRKTANVVASVAFGVPAIAVDTHVFRVSNRLGLVKANNVTMAEKQLMEQIPEQKWSQAHHWLIWHGRQFCTARAPKCEECFVSDCCAEFLGLIPRDAWRGTKGVK